MKRMWTKKSIGEVAVDSVQSAFTDGQLMPFVIKTITLTGEDFTDTTTGELKTSAIQKINDILDKYIPIMGSVSEDADTATFVPIWAAGSYGILRFGDIIQPNGSYEDTHTTSATTVDFNSPNLKLYDDVCDNAGDYLAEYGDIEITLLCVPR